MKGTLENRDFKDFTLQLEGLISIYNLNADKIIKSQAFTSLQFLETDIAQLFELQSAYMTDPFEIIHKSDVGFVQKRRGGEYSCKRFHVKILDSIRVLFSYCRTSDENNLLHIAVRFAGYCYEHVQTAHDGRSRRGL